MISGLRLCLLGWLLCLWGVSARTLAEPLVRVRAESRIELGVTHNELALVVSGALRDELGQALGTRALAIEIAPAEDPESKWRTTLNTDPEGRFSLELPEADRDYRLLATFAGDDTHRGVRVERRVERARADVRLELRLPEGNIVDLDAPALRANVVAESDAGGDAIAMRLLDESGRELTRGVTDKHGRLTLVVASSALGEPGAGLVRVESLRDQRRAEAQTEARIVRKRAVLVALRSADDRPEAGSAIDVTGRVTTRSGPRHSVPVGLYADDRHLETVVTDEMGRFAARLWIDAAPGPMALAARVQGDASGAYADAEASLAISIVAARPLPIGWVIGALVLCALPAVWFSSRGNLGRAESQAAGDGPSGTSIHPARAQGRRDRHRVHGRALDTRSDTPISSADVELMHEKPEACVRLPVDAQGRFASPVLPAGRVRLRISAPGYVATETALEIPHRGEWSSFVVRLISLRAHALLPYRRLLLKLLPSARAWGIWTPREAHDFLAQRHPVQKTEITELTLDVERACYAAEGPSEAEALDIETKTRALETAFETQGDKQPVR